MEASTAVENATAAANGEGDRPPFSLELSQDQKDIRDWVHGFAADVVRPAAHEWDEREETPWEIIQEAAKIGLYGFESLAQFFADESGLLLPIVNEELFWGDAGIGMAIMGTSLAVAAIFGQGTGEQIGEWIPRCFGTADDVKVAAFCASEPERRLRRLRRPHAARSTTRPPTTWVLNGQKAWATNGGIADVHVVIATVDPELGSRGHAAFVIPIETAGISQGTKVKKHGLRASHTADVFLDDCRVPGREPARRQGEARRAPRPRPRGPQGRRPGRDADLRGQRGRPSAPRRSASPAPPTSTRWTTPRSASSSARRSSRTSRSPSRWPT